MHVFPKNVDFTAGSRAWVKAAFLCLFGSTLEAQGCHPSYEGACVPIASDVDCAGGSGNGPEYVRGPVYVVGPDVYDLGRDGDCIACEK